MRKKSKKKQIVAMTLALSVLSSSVGMCGASAAEALSDTDASGLQVTVVPLADNTEAHAPTAESKTPAQKEETPAENEQPVASTGDNTDQPTDGEGDGDNTSSDDKPTIERPEQSETVETLPGTAEDNKDHIKGEDKDDSKDDTSEPETPAEGEEKGETPAEGEGTGTEEKPEEKPEEDLDYSVAYDPDTGHFKVTFNIKEDAEGDQTVELSKVQEVVEKYGEKQFDKWIQTDGAKWMDDALWCAQYGQSSEKTVDFNGASYTLYVYYDEETGSVAQRVAYTEEPGCTTIFDVSLSNGSKHTYVYKDSSLTVATPDVSNTDKTGIKGFDGQELPEDYSDFEIHPNFSSDANDTGCIESIIDKALKSSESNIRLYYDPATDEVSTTYQKISLKDKEAVLCSDGFYRIPIGDGRYYAKFTSAQVKEVPKGSKHYVVTQSTGKNTEVYKEDCSAAYAPYERRNDGSGAFANEAKIRYLLGVYLRDNNTNLESEVLAYYNTKDNTNYSTLNELFENNPEAAAELTKTGENLDELDPQDSNQILTISTSQFYDNFYKNILSFKVGDPKDVEGDATGNIDHGHSHGQWATDSGSAETIGQYMADELTKSGKWAEANAYFNQLLAAGLSSEEATWAAFTMATNIDFQNAGNDYQNTAWNWYASMVLHQADGTLDLTKTDKKTGEIIGDDEGEGQTSFYLWKYETDKKTGEKDTMYCTYVEPTYTTNKDGEQVLEKDGFYCWVKYDPTKDKLTYTVTTTNGKLNIDYALLENVVYYLQEAIAPDGYDTDPEIYVICDEESYKELEGTEVTNPATGATSKVTESSWLGSILGGKTLSINFMNTATVVPDPDPEPTPDPDPVPPVDPDIPVDPANPDNPPVQDETPDETPVTPENPQNPAVQDATPDAAALPQTGTTSWMAGVLASLGSLLLACGWFFTRKQYSPKH